MMRRRRSFRDRFPERIGIVLAAGGERVIGWETGVLAGLADAGWDPRAASAVLGTSAGSLVAARLAADVDPRTDAELVAAAGSNAAPQEVRRAVAESMDRIIEVFWGQGAKGDESTRRRLAGEFASSQPGALSSEEHVARQSARLLGVGWPPTLQMAAIDADTGERFVFDAATGVPLAEAVAGARAIPGLVQPVEVAGRRVIDGAIGSATNADLLPLGLKIAIVVTATPAVARMGSLASTPAPGPALRWGRT
jgi:NTE family protein